MAKIRVEFENCVEEWWDAARELASSMREPTFTRVLNAIERADEVAIDRADAAAFLSVAAKLPGWKSGPLHARHPVIVKLDA